MSALVGGIVPFWSRVSVKWGVLIAVFVGATGPGAMAIWLFSQVMVGSGSGAGNILRVGFGAVLMLISVVSVAIGAIYLTNVAGHSQSHS
jgi:hypothetical protein